MTPTPNSQPMGTPNWKKKGWFSPSQQFAPAGAINPDVDNLDVSTTASPPSPLFWNGVHIQEEAGSGYLFMADLRKAAGPPLSKVPFANWSLRKGKEIMERIAATLSVTVDSLLKGDGRKLWIERSTALSWIEGYSPDLYQYLKQARPDPSARLVATDCLQQDDIAPSPRMEALEAEIKELRDLVSQLLPLAEKVKVLESNQKALPAPSLEREEPQEITAYDRPKYTHYPVSTWIGLRGIKVHSTADAGKALTKICKDKGLQIRKAETGNPTYPTVNSYPVYVLESFRWETV